MKRTLQAQLVALGTEVQAAAVPDGCKQTAAWCIRQLPPLYAEFGQTNESRYGDEITRLVQGVLKALATSKPVSPEAQRLAVRITNRLRLLHEQFGFPGLKFKPVGALQPRSRKAGYADAQK